ncbi:MAG TPA: hypothetical protein VEW42_06635 [Candidatus Eisenbacteria bacterium]|nr:hypothetical protein [Candidatus Eisenbacteria bacterium]
MKKKVIVVVVVLLLLLLVGAGYYLYTKSAQKMAPKVENEEHGGVFNTIKDALSKNLSLECHFTSDEGVATVAYLKLGSVHVDANVGKSDATSILMKDKKMYFWQVGSKKGTIMNVPEVSITPSTTGSMQPTLSAGSGSSTGQVEDKSQGLMTTLEKFKESCKPAAVADSLFTPPSDVTFTDMSQMMKAIPSSTPSGYPTGMTQQDVQKMMQQYKPTGY